MSKVLNFLQLACFSMALTSCALMTHSTQLPPGAIETSFEISNSHIKVPVRIGRHDYEAVYDSGAEVSLMSAAVAQELGLHPQSAEAGHGFGGDIQSGQVSDVRIELGGGAYTFPHLAVVDFTPMIGPGARLDFILGPTLLPDDVVDINPSSHLMRWTPQQRFRAPAGAVVVALGHQGGTFTMPMTVNGTEGHAGIDLGSGTAIDLSAEFAQRLGLNPNDGATRQSTGVGGQFQSYAASVPRITIAGVEIHDVPVEIHAGALPTDADINLGTPILFRFRLALDYAGQRAWLVSSATAATAPFARDLVGMSISRRAPDRFTVSFVSSRGPAHDAGLVEGSQIVAVDGVAVADLPRDRPAFPGGVGATHMLTLEGGRAVMITLSRYY